MQAAAWQADNFLQYGNVAHDPWAPAMVDFSCAQVGTTTTAAAATAAQATLWMQSIIAQVQHLQKQVVGLEEWKKKAQVDVQALRAEQEVLRAELGRLPMSGGATLGGASARGPTDLVLSELVVPGVGAGAAQPELSEATPPLSPPGLPLPLARASTCPAAEFGDSLTPPLLPAPPGLSMPAALPKLQPLARASTVPAEGAYEGVVVSPSEVAGKPCERAEWRIGSLRKKLKECMGRPLVSPPFNAHGLANLRLMVFPDAKEPMKGMRSRRQKEQYTAMVSQGPLHGALRFKAAGLAEGSVVTFCLTLGDIRRGPYAIDFSEQAVHGCSDFGVDWLEQVDSKGDGGGLTVGVEVLDVQCDAPEGTPDSKRLSRSPASACQSPSTAEGTSSPSSSARSS